jgi:hypothetical protein
MWCSGFCSKLRAPRRGTSLGPFVCGARAFSLCSSQLFAGHPRPTQTCGWWGASQIELEPIQTQMAQKPKFRVEWECASVAQRARTKIGGHGPPSPSQSAIRVWVLRALEGQKRRRVTCGTRRCIISEVKNDLFGAQGALCSAPGQMPRQGRSSFFSRREKGALCAESYQWAAFGLADPSQS